MTWTGRCANWSGPAPCSPGCGTCTGWPPPGTTRPASPATSGPRRPVPCATPASPVSCWSTPARTSSASGWPTARRGPAWLAVVDAGNARAQQALALCDEAAALFASYGDRRGEDWARFLRCTLLPYAAPGGTEVGTAVAQEELAQLGRTTHAARDEKLGDYVDAYQLAAGTGGEPGGGLAGLAPGHGPQPPRTRGDGGAHGVADAGRPGGMTRCAPGPRGRYARPAPPKPLVTAPGSRCRRRLPTAVRRQGRGPVAGTSWTGSPGAGRQDPGVGRVGRRRGRRRAARAGGRPGGRAAGRASGRAGERPGAAVTRVIP
ncbi:hypothetical protein SHIRM173S_04721 [Streptomyces hirsutus]